MILYRARTVASRPSRHPAYANNTPQSRIAGRWFTSDLARAEAHLKTLAGTTEIVSIEIDDAIIEGFSVATKPSTTCGLEPGAYSDAPALDYVVPLFFVMSAQAKAVAGQRKPDVIDVNGGEFVDISAQIARRRMAKAA